MGWNWSYAWIFLGQCPILPSSPPKQEGEMKDTLLTTVTDRNILFWQEKCNRRFNFRNKLPYYRSLASNFTYNSEVQLAENLCKSWTWTKSFSWTKAYFFLELMLWMTWLSSFYSSLKPLVTLWFLKVVCDAYWCTEFHLKESRVRGR